MTNDFQYDVFLSHSAKDKALVRPLAERLRKDGLPTDHQPAKRLDDASIKGSLAQFLYINWLPAVREQEYANL